LWAAAVLLVGYAVACAALGDPSDPYSLNGWFGNAIDRALLGTAHLYRGEGVPFDPEGLASTPPAIAQVLLGWWVGDLIQRDQAQRAKGSRGLGLPAEAGAVSPARLVRLFVVATGLRVADHRPGHAGAGGAVALWQRALQPLLRFFEVFGRNPLLVFVLSGFVPRVLACVCWPCSAAARRAGRALSVPVVTPKLKRWSGAAPGRFGSGRHLFWIRPSRNDA